MNYRCSKFLIFFRYYSEMGHYIFFVRLPYYFVYISSFPTIMKRKFYFCDYLMYKSFLELWQRKLKKPNMISFPDSKELRRKLFKKLVNKKNEN